MIQLGTGTASGVTGREGKAGGKRRRRGLYKRRDRETGVGDPGVERACHVVAILCRRGNRSPTRRLMH